MSQPVERLLSAVDAIADAAQLAAERGWLAKLSDWWSDRDRVRARRARRSLRRQLREEQTRGDA